MDGIVDQYQEINRQSLKVQLAMFRSKYTFTSSSEVATIIRRMPVEVRGLFDEVESLVWLLLFALVSWTEAERRLNNAVVCHEYQDTLGSRCITNICQQFISVNEKQRRVKLLHIQ